MKAIFVELPAFTRNRSACLDDPTFRAFQQELMRYPEAGDVIANTGGLRKVRFADVGRGKGKRGGLRIIYYWWQRGEQFWLFTVYDKDETDDLSYDQRKLLRQLLEREVRARELT